VPAICKQCPPTSHAAKAISGGTKSADLATGDNINNVKAEIIPHQSHGINSDEKPSFLPQFAATLTAALVQLGLGSVAAIAGVTIPRLTNQNSDDLILDMHQVALYGMLWCIFYLKWID